MAKKIAPTPILDGKDAEEFLKEMKRPNTKEETEHWQKLEKGRKVYFL
ncbi:MAG: hypothetical protein ACRCVG_07090 [Methanobacteriaceae archaeon]